MEVTKREILVSISFLLVMILLGIFITDKVIYSLISKKEMYNKALKIDNDIDTFKYALDTEVGNILTYGNFKVENGVTIEGLSNDYTLIRRITEQYTKHTRTKCDDDGNCKKETYHTWDEISNELWNTNKIKFNDVIFDLNTFSGYQLNRLELNKTTVNNEYIDKIRNDFIYENNSFWKHENDLRYSYYIVHKDFSGTIFAKAKDKTIKSINGNSIEIKYSTIKEVLEDVKNSEIEYVVIFWIMYLTIVGIIICYYVANDNKYLED